jgi:hypothetical protein
VFENSEIENDTIRTITNFVNMQSINMQSCNHNDACDAMGPFMRSMECIPEDDEDSENENPLIATINKSFYHGNSMKNDASAKLEDLRTRLDTFWSKGWVSKKEYEQHLDFLSSFDVSCIGSNGKFALRELEREFDTMEEEKSEPPPQSWSDMFMSNFGLAAGNDTRKSSASGLTSFWSNSMAVSVSEDEEDDQPPPLASSTNRSVKGAREPTIVAPRDLANVLSEHTVSELFVETCFFGRLGFVQPPCCMSCTYREALKGNIPHVDCQNWVVWRKNANRSFDPSNNNKIGDNALAVRCATARKLIAGKYVEGYQWDARQKMLLRKR